MESLNDPLNTVGLRERKKVETRRTIRQVALDLALDRGVETLTVEAIAEAAEVSPRTFFNYFSSKEEALVSDTAAVATRLRSLIVERPRDESPMQSLCAVITGSEPQELMWADRERSPARQRLVQENPTLMSQQLAQYAAMENELAAAFAERLGVDPVEDLWPALLAAVSVSSIRVAIRRWTAGGTASLWDVLRSVFELVDEGVLTAPSGKR